MGNVCQTGASSKRQHDLKHSLLENYLADDIGFVIETLGPLCHDTRMNPLPAAPIEVSHVTPPALRGGLALIGAVFATLATTELWRDVWPLSALTPFFGFILITALFGCAGLISWAVMAPDETWTISPAHLTIKQSLRALSNRLHYQLAQIDEITVQSHDWDSRPATYFLAIVLKSGKRLNSPEFGTETKANAAKAVLQGQALQPPCLGARCGHFRRSWGPLASLR